MIGNVLKAKINPKDSSRTRFPNKKEVPAKENFDKALVKLFIPEKTTTPQEVFRKNRATTT